MERKLAVILVADVVGYSAQMERDEAGTYARVTARRHDIFEPEIARHQGRIFKLVGDGILAEFGSVVQAVECAVLIQTALAARNAEVPTDQTILARIGINLGEVIVDGDDRYGEGVNIAARLEGLADPGGICVSEKVAREVEKRLAFGFEPMGPQKVKNIAEPVMAFRVNALSGTRAAKRTPSPERWIVLAGLVALILTLTATFAFRTPARLALDQTPVLALVRFANLTGNPDRDFLTTGLPEGIAIVLGSSTAFGDLGFFQDYLTGGTAEDTKAAAATLDADLMLEGSILTAAEGLRLSMRLMDGATGQQVAAFEDVSVEGDLPGLQFRIAKETLDNVRAFTGTALGKPLDPAWGSVTAENDEYMVALRAWAANYESAFAANDEALRRIASGLERYPQSVLLRIVKAERFLVQARSGPDDARWNSAQAAWEILEGLPPASGMGPSERWYLHLVRAELTPLATGDFKSAMKDAEAAHALTPGLTWANLRLSDVAANAGYGERAAEWARVGIVKGRNLSIGHRQALAWALLVAGKPEEALAEYALIWEHCLPCEVVALVRTGQIDKARSLVNDIRTNRPDLTIATERTYPTGHQPFMAEPFLTAYLDDLRAAGLPEGTAPPP